MKKTCFILLSLGLFISCANTSSEMSFTQKEDNTETILLAEKTKKQEQRQVQQEPKPLVYYNERYGYTIKYPCDFGDYKESDNGDGMTAHKKNGSMLISVSASFNIFEDEDIYSIMETYKSWMINSGCTISYQFAKGKTIVLSGHTKGGLIFYEKNVLYSVDGNEYIATVYYEYPESEKAAGDAAIALIGNFPRP